MVADHAGLGCFVVLTPSHSPTPPSRLFSLSDVPLPFLHRSFVLFEQKITKKKKRKNGEK